MKSCIMTITPDIAARMLESNHPKNRSISSEKVSAYARMIKDGTFILTPQGISFDVDGILIDGQHRLEAICKAGIPVDMYVTTEAPRESIEVLDTQRPRTLLQRRRMAGQENDTSEVALVKFLFRYEFRNHFQDDRIWRVLDDYVDSVRLICRLSTHGIHNGKCKLAPITAALWSAYISGVPEETLDKFCRIANNGFYDSESETAAVVFSRSVDAIKTNGEMGRTDIFLMTQEAINSFAKGQSRRIVWKDPKPVYYNGKPRDIITGQI